jgi:zona occludens toxin (predicted ATPase)
MSWVYGLDEDQHVYEYKKSTGEFFHVYYANKTGDGGATFVRTTFFRKTLVRMTLVRTDVS